MKALTTLGKVVVLVLAGAAAAVLVLAMLDPACGPDGDSQRAWMAELAHDVINIFTK